MIEEQWEREGPRGARLVLNENFLYSANVMVHSFTLVLR